jgi:hypothetical protein
LDCAALGGEIARRRMVGLDRHEKKIDLAICKKLIYIDPLSYAVPS